MVALLCFFLTLFASLFNAHFARPASGFAVWACGFSPPGECVSDGAYPSKGLSRRVRLLPDRRTVNDSREAASNRDRLAGHPAGLRGREKHRDRRDVVRLP